MKLHSQLSADADKTHQAKNLLLVVDLRVDELDDLRVATELLQELDLVDERRSRLGVATSQLDSLERIDVVVTVEHAEDFGRASLAEQACLGVRSAVDL